MEETDWILPGNGVGTGWTWPNYLTTDNVTYHAYQVVGTFSTTELLIGTQYDFSSIPAGATINGIEVQVHVDTDSSTMDESQIQLYGNSTVQGDDKSTGASIAQAWTNMTYGGSDDLWGWDNITANDIKSSGFGMAVAYYKGTGIADYVFVNTIRIKVYYTPNDGFIPLSMAAF